MWVQFLIDLFFLIALVYGFGALVAFAFTSSWVKSICYAPLYSFGGLFLVSVLRCAAGLTTSWKGIVFPFCFVALIVFCIKLLMLKKHFFELNLENDHKSNDCKLLGIYVIVACVVALFVYLKTLDSSVSFFQGYDNYYHINTVRQYLNTGLYCSLPVTQYPNLWHCLVAITASFGSFAVQTAINAFNFFLIGFVIPTSVYLFMDSIFIGDREVIFAGAFSTVFCNTFPWNYVCNGPLYALLIGWALLPISMALFVKLCQSNALSVFIKRFVYFGLSCLALVVAHPSVIFAGLIILAPFGAYSIFSVFYSRCRFRVLSSFIAALFLLILFVFWNYCFNSPLFAGVVHFSWEAPVSLSQAFANALIGSLSDSYSPQLLLMFFVMLGLVFLLKRSRYRWLIASLVVTAFFYIVAEGINGYWRQFFCGFWYNDWNRLAGIYGFTLSIVAAPGLVVTYRLLGSIFGKCLNDRPFFNSAFSVLCFFGLLLVFVMMPSFSIPEGTYTTPFGYVRSKLSEYNDLSAKAICFDSSEISFTNEVKSIVGDSKVLNYPYDGSCFAYAISNLNIVNRKWWVDDLDENHPDALVRMKINDVSFNKQVQDACKKLDISYVMLLDYGHSFGDGVFNYTHRVAEAWTGLTSITDSTPGLKLLLSEGDMRLYRIEK